MPSLETVGRRFENKMVRADGFPFTAAVMPMDEGGVAAYDFSYPRIYFRLRRDSAVGTGDIVIDPAGRRYLLADHDQPAIYNTILYRSHLAFQMNSTPVWQRESKGVRDPLTGLNRAGGKDELGRIEALIEMFGRESRDGAIRVAEQTRRMVTNAPIQLGDVIDDMVVRRLDTALGVWVAEIE